MAADEKILYEPVRAALGRAFASIGKTIVSETAATKGFGEPTKALIPIGSDILFRFMSLKPDIVGFVEREGGRELFTVEVKPGKPTVKAIFQAKLYKELFGAGIGFLIATEPIPEELRRLVRNRPTILYSAEWSKFGLLTIGQFDVATCNLVEWIGTHSPEADPFTYLTKRGF